MEEREKTGPLDFPNHIEKGSYQGPPVSPNLDWIKQLSDEEDADRDLVAVGDHGQKRSSAETARMFKLRRNLDELDSFHRQKERDVLKARETLALCRQNIQSLLKQRENLEEEIGRQKAEDNSVAVFRLRVQLKVLCQKLLGEEEQGALVHTELNQLESELSKVQVELGRFSPLRQELQEEEERFQVFKAQKAATRLRNERKAIHNHRVKMQHLKEKHAAMAKDEELEGQKKTAESHGNRKMTAKYLKELHRQEVEKDVQNRHLLEKRMQAVNSLKSSIETTQETLRVQQTKAKAKAQKKEAQERQLKESLQNQDISTVKHVYQQKQLEQMKHKREEFVEKQKSKKEAIMAKMLQEGKHAKSSGKKQQQTKLPKEVARAKLLQYLGPGTTEPTDKKPAVHRQFIHTSSSSESSSDDDDWEESTCPETDHQRQSDSLAQPEFSGLWEQKYKIQKLQADMAKIWQKTEGPGVSSGTLDPTAKNLHGKESFTSKPDVVIFKDFEVGKTYKKKVVLTNTGYTSNHLRLMGTSLELKDFVSIQFEPPGSVPAGMSCEMQLIFLPSLNRDLEGHVHFGSSAGPFSVLVRCLIKKCELEVDSQDIDFGSHVVGQIISRTITLTNKGALGTVFTLEPCICPSPVPAPVCSEPSTPKVPGSQASSTGSDAGEKQPEAENQEETQKEKPESEGSTENPEETPEEVLDTEVVEDKEDDEVVEEIVTETCDIRLGDVTSGEIKPFDSAKFDVFFTPTILGEAKLEFYIKSSDESCPPILMSLRGTTVSTPVFFSESNIDLKICMFDCLYQDTVSVQSRSSASLKVTFEVCPEMRKYIDIIPKSGFIQAQSSFNAQLKFLPRRALTRDARMYYDRDTGVMEVPLVLRVAGQIEPVHFTLNAVVTCSDLKFDRNHVDFGCCSVFLSVKSTVRLTNLSLLPQDFGFLNVPKFVEVQPNDGFGTLLPQETLDIDLIFSASKAKEYDFQLHCKSGMNRDFLLTCHGVGVRPPVEVSHTMVNFGATAIGDYSTAIIYLTNTLPVISKSKQASAAALKDPPPHVAVIPRLFSFVVPPGSNVTLTPSRGRLLPGEKCLIQVTFRPKLQDLEIREEARRQLEEEALVREEMRKQALLEQEQSKKDEPKGRRGRTQNKEPSGDQPTEEPEVVPTIEEIDPRSEVYERSKALLLHNFTQRYNEYTIPCFISDGDPPEENRQAQPPWSQCNTLYLMLQCPMVRPSLVVLSDYSHNVVDFSHVSLGQKIIKKFSIRNVSEEPCEMSSSVLDVFGPFSILNALRTIRPGEKHTLLLAFAPAFDKKFCELLQIRTHTMTLEVTLRGEGVSPEVTSSPEGGILDFGYVLEKESTVRVVELQNCSPVPVDFSTMLTSASPSRPKGGVDHVEVLLGNFTDPKTHPVVGTQNFSGLTVFVVNPAEGTIAPFETLRVSILFQPDHPSVYFSDRLTIVIMKKRNVCVLDLKGAASSHNMYVCGGDILTVPVESLLPPLKGYQGQSSEDPDSAIPVLVTLRASSSEGSCTPAVRELRVGCIRSVSRKKGGEFSFDGLSALAPMGFTVEPGKGSLEPGKEQVVTITWAPQEGYKPFEVVQATVSLTVKGDEKNVHRVTLMALVSTSSSSSPSTSRPPSPSAAADPPPQ